MAIPIPSSLTGSVCGYLDVEMSGPPPGSSWLGIGAPGGPRYHDAFASRGRRYLELMPCVGCACVCSGTRESGGGVPGRD